VSRRAGEFDGFVIACHGDPGVGLARHHARTVFGIGETSMLVACAYADHFGLLTLGEGLVPAKRRQVEQAGLAGRCVAIEPTGTGVLHGVDPDVDMTPYVRAGQAALDQKAQALVLGCAGMVYVCGRLAAELRVPVIEPVAATCLVAATTSGAAANTWRAGSVGAA
jgi:allantoin racemase